MKLVIIESPFAGDIITNIIYARRCVRDSLKRGEAPIASHLLYTQEGILRDELTSERKLGIDAGLAWSKVSDFTAVYYDYGISNGMKYGIDTADKNGKLIQYREIGKNDQ